MTRKWRVWLAAAGIIAAGLPLHAAAPAAATTARYTFLQFNMAGHMNHLGHTDHIVPAVTESITSSWPTAVSLNEVCENQFAEIYWNANVAGGGYNAKFHATIPAARGGPCGGHAYGLALLLRGENPNAFSVHPLTSPQHEARVMICGYTGVSGERLGVCSSHLTPNEGNTQYKYQQMDQIARQALIPLAEAGLPTAFLGDTYLSPAEMSYITRGLYSHAAEGNTKTNPNCVATTWTRDLAQQYPEGSHADWVRDCDAGRLTRQTDYVMVSNNRLASVSGEVTRTRWSDHLPVRGTAVFR